MKDDPSTCYDCACAFCVDDPDAIQQVIDLCPKHAATDHLITALRDLLAGHVELVTGGYWNAEKDAEVALAARTLLAGIDNATEKGEAAS